MALSIFRTRPADIAAFLAAECCRPDGEKRLAANTLRLRVAAIGYLHYLAGCPSPTTMAAVTETFAGLDRLAKKASQGPKPKLAAKIGILCAQRRWLAEYHGGDRLSIFRAYLRRIVSGYRCIAGQDVRTAISRLTLARRFEFERCFCYTKE
jgi:hypothetical protein